jgi:hypothetical protein
MLMAHMSLTPVAWAYGVRSRLLAVETAVPSTATERDLHRYRTDRPAVLKILAARSRSTSSPITGSERTR